MTRKEQIVANIESIAEGVESGLYKVNKLEWKRKAVRSRKEGKFKTYKPGSKIKITLGEIKDIVVIVQNGKNLYTSQSVEN